MSSQPPTRSQEPMESETHVPERMVKVTLPEMGESVTEGSIVEFRKKVGDHVVEGDPIVEVTTDKVDVEVPATASGVITRILVGEGERLAVGAVIAEIDTSADAAPVVATPPGAPSKAAGSPKIVAVTLPEMGESVTAGSVVEFRKKVGDPIAEGETLVEITTDKVDVEVPAPVAGIVTAILAQAGESLAVGATLAEIDANGAVTAPPKSATPSAAPPKPTVNGSAISARSGPLAASHQAQRIARKLAVDLGGVRGSGPEGMVLRGDLLAQAAGAKVVGAPMQPVLAPLGRQSKCVELKGPAAALAGYMEASLTIPTATSFRTLGVDILDARRKELNAALKGAGSAAKVSFTHLIAFAIVRAARELPFITAHFRRENGKPTRVEPGVHLGLAVDAQRKDGTRFLVVPVVKSADELDFKGFHSAYDELVVKARENKLGADDLQGASFTLTNPGGIGTVASVPRLMAGQGAILATGAIGYPPGFANIPEATLRELGVGKIMQMTSTYDHRVIQGAQSGEFLRLVDELLQGKHGFFEAVFSSFGLQAEAHVGIAVASPAPSISSTGAAPSDELLRAVAAAQALVSGYRTYGHLAANLDPLGSQPQGDPKLDPATFGLTPALQAAVPASVLNVHVGGSTLADVLPRLKETYASTLAYEVEHISHTEQRRWLREYIEGGKHRATPTREAQLRVLDRLTQGEVFERFLRKTFLGQKTFSGEGLDVMVPMLQEMLEMLVVDGVPNAVIGMAHRGRLNTIAHVVNTPYNDILAEFEAAHRRGQSGDDDVTGDVKYHHGATGVFESSTGKKIVVILANNPSHLEAVDPVVEGQARALQTDHSQNMPSQDVRHAVPILIHGDAAFPGQGIVAEVFNLQSLAGYATGGTLHLIANNQVGFTTDVADARSTRYASDLAKGFDVPIVHVNADDIDGCIAAIVLAHDFRRAFQRDIVIDVIGYRRFGHNEQDEPAYTQPTLYEKIKSHPTARELFANKLLAQGVVTADESSEMIARAATRLQEAYKAVKDEDHGSRLEKIALAQVPAAPVLIPINRAALLAWSERLVSAPQGFTINKKLVTQFERRRAIMAEKGFVDWGMAEGLAFASLLASGVPIRMTGQDTGRGTFSHRHAILRDANTGVAYVPLQHLSDAKASFEIHNSPLSEYACLGFEYGYASQIPQALVLWEAQFGDFVNGAQIIIDQFIAAGQAKWGQTSRLTLLLPHGYEGQGPEHSSARLERFLQLTAEGNLRVAYPTTAGNYFHLLRMQASAPNPVPLVVMTPKSLLRAEVASGVLDDMATASFKPILDDPNVRDKAKIERILLCTGKIYYDLVAAPAYGALAKTAIVRLELLSPMPADAMNALFATYPNLKRLVWVQEEPKNMGARAYARRRLLERFSKPLDIEYVGRSYRASPSEGYAGAHAVEQERIIAAALHE